MNGRNRVPCPAAVTTAGRRGRSWRASSRCPGHGGEGLGEAAEGAADPRADDGIEVYQIGIHIALGDSAAALAHARAVTQARLRTPERRAKFLVDTARAWQHYGRPDQACRALLAAERHAPEEIRRASFRTLITAIAQAPGPRPAGLRELASRAGAQV